MVPISVIIPARNAEKTIEACLTSLQKQSFHDKEIIIVDDHSTDATSLMAGRYGKVVKPERRLGVGAARNFGAKHGNGEIFVFTDADCVCPADWLEKIFEDMRREKVKVWAGGYSHNLENNFLSDFAHLELAFRRRNLPRFVQTAVANNFACDKDVFQEIGGFPNDHLASEDMVLSFFLSRKYRIYWNPNNGVGHHYKTALSAYLKQQYWFAKDTIRRFFQYPELLSAKTHQGRAIQVEIFLTAACLLSFLSSYFFKPLVILAILGYLAVLSLNLPFYVFLKKNKGLLFVLKIIPVQLLRNLTCVAGSLAGVGKEIAQRG